MLRIHYTHSHWEAKDFANVESLDLHYDNFPGSVRLEQEGQRIDMDWDWIPLFDFANCLLYILDQLAVTPDATATFDFTESGDEIQFKRTGPALRLYFTYSDEVMDTTLADLTQAVKDFAHTLTAELLEAFPSLQQNDLFQQHLAHLHRLA